MSDVDERHEQLRARLARAESEEREHIAADNERKRLIGQAARLICAAGVLCLFSQAWLAVDGYLRRDWPRMVSTLPVAFVVVVSMRLIYKMSRGGRAEKSNEHDDGRDIPW